MAYFFDEEELKNLFSRCGFDCVRSAILTPTVVNNKEKKSMDRVFVQVFLFLLSVFFSFFLNHCLPQNREFFENVRNNHKMKMYI